MTPERCELGEVSRTPRGFEFVNFDDSNRMLCSLKQSSAIRDYKDAFYRPGTSCVWLGEEGGAVMHLDRESVRSLVDTLTRWLDTGHFYYDAEDAQ